MAWLISLVLLYILAVVTYHVYVRYLSSKRYNFQSKYPPVIIEPWYCPFLGPVFSLLDIESAIQKWRTKYGDNFTLVIFGYYITFITKHVDLKKYYTAPDNMLSLVKAAKVLLGSIFPESQYMAEPVSIPYLQNILNTRALSYMVTNVEIILHDYFNAKNGIFWEKNGDIVKIDLFDFMYRLTLCTNSINFMSERVYRNHVDELVEIFSVLDVEKNILSPHINNLKKKFGFKNKSEAAWERWIQLLMPDIQRCLKMIENDIKPTELDTAYELVKFSKEELEKRGESFTPRLAAYLAFTSFFPAQFNTYTTAAFMILEWIRHEHDEIGLKMKEEIDHAPPMGEITIDYLNSMEYIQACIYEIIRIRTDSPLALRYAGEDVLLSDQTYIPAGNLVVNPITRALDLYKNPEKFDPERHLVPREENKGDIYRALPFGRGKHPCTGERYVKMQIKILLIQLTKMCKMEIMKESLNFETTINKKQLAGLSRPTKPVFIKLSKKE